MTDRTAIEDYWREARIALPHLPEPLPEAWGFGATPEHADELLELVLAGIKVGTASSLWDYEESGIRCRPSASSASSSMGPALRAP